MGLQNSYICTQRISIFYVQMAMHELMKILTTAILCVFLGKIYLEIPAKSSLNQYYLSH